MDTPNPENPMQPHQRALDPELKHVEHARLAPWVHELPEVRQDLLDEVNALDAEAIQIERVILGLIAGLNARKKQVIWTITHVWTQAEIDAAKAKWAEYQRKMGP